MLPRSLSRALVLFAIALLAGCGFAHIQIAQPMTGGGRYQNAAIGRIQVESYEHNDDANKLNERFTRLTEQLLRQEVGKRYRLVETTTEPGTLVVDVHVIIQYGNRGLRYAGLGGQGSVDSTLTVVDGSSGEIQMRASSLSDLAMGLFGGDMKATVEDNIETLVRESGL